MVTHHLVLALLASLFLSMPVWAEDGVTNLQLDGLSHISLGGEDVLAIPPGSKIGVRFGRPGPFGVSFTVAPADVLIPAIETPDGDALRYALASPASGLVSRGKDGQLTITLSAAITASREGSGAQRTYHVSLTTETASAQSADGTSRVEISGMKLVEGANHLQLVAAITNDEKATLAPGKPVTVVVSGTFDQPVVFP